MKKNHIRIVLLALFILINTLSFGQVKQITPPNITNPFQTNKVKRQGTIIKPQKTNESVKQNEDFIFQTEQNNIIIQFNEKSQTKASDFFQKFTRKLEIKNDDTFSLIKSENDNIGFTHYRYQQNYKNLPLDGVQFLLHEKNGKLVSANGNFYSNINISTTPSISEQ